MRDGEGVDVDVADSQMLSGVDGFDAVEALAKRVGKDTLHGVHGGLGDVERGLPDAQHLGQAVAMVGVLVGDEDAVETVDTSFEGGEAGECFALAKSGVHQESGALGLE